MAYMSNKSGAPEIALSRETTILNKGTYLSYIIYHILENTTHISSPRTFAGRQATTNTSLTFFCSLAKPPEAGEATSASAVGARSAVRARI